MSKNRNAAKKTAARLERKIGGKMSRKKALHLFSFQFRRWREGIPICRSDLARIAEVDKFVLCYMEHEEVDQVRFQDVLRVLNALRTISSIPQSEEDQIRGLLKAATRPKSRRTCHRPHSGKTGRR